MSETPPGRAVRSSGKEDGRSARARATRARIVAAATELFTTAGYTTTSITAIAARAGVSEQTVYYAFGTKRAVLTAALDQAVAGDDEPVPTLERPWVRDALADPEPLGQIRRQVTGAGEIHLRAAPLLDVVRSAAATDSDLAEVWAVNIRQRLTVLEVLMGALARKTPLRDGLDPAAAADIALVILSPETYNLLVSRRRWGHLRWREWAVDSLARLLTTLPPAPAPEPAPGRGALTARDATAVRRGSPPAGPPAPAGLVVRPMHDDDAEQVLAIYQAGLDGGQASLETAAPGWQDFTAGRPARLRFVAADAATGEVTGWVAASAVSSRRVYAGVVEHSVYVHPRHQGRGVGRALLEALIAACEEAGIWTIQSGVFPENAPSLRLHEALGFRVVGVRERVGRHRGVWRDVVLLERRSTVVGR
ncbi:GNAT family N-acetyltransferase [Planomonospora corallina]|uniref:GNAT family N-acetyltransferase n=1 Tax=Planomonospora corallina TaxID=1806052 RepID=A0ABV8I4F2_9ACTN